MWHFITFGIFILCLHRESVYVNPTLHLASLRKLGLVIGTTLLSIVAALGPGLQYVPAQAATAGNGQFKQLWETVLLDTRSGSGTPTGASAQIPAEGSLTFRTTGKAGIPASSVAAVSLKFIVHSPAAGGWLEAYPAGESAPHVSSLTWAPGESTAGADFTRVSDSGTITIVNHGTGPIHLTASTNGYFQDAAGAGDKTGYVPVESAVVYDTRSGTGTPARTTPIPANSEVSFQVLGRAGIPADANSAAAVAFNVVASQQTAGGSISLRNSGVPGGGNPILSYIAGEANSAFTIAQSAASGTFIVRNNGSGTVHVSVSVRGYFDFANSATAGRFMPTHPQVIVETLEGTGVNGDQTPIPAGGSITISTAAYTGQPSNNLVAVALSINVRGPMGDGYVSVYRPGRNDPKVPTVYFSAGESNVGFETIAPDDSGRVSVANHSTGTIHLQITGRGYFVKSTGEEGTAIPAEARQALDSIKAANGEVSQDNRETLLRYPVIGGKVLDPSQVEEGFEDSPETEEEVPVEEFPELEGTMAAKAKVKATCKITNRYQVHHTVTRTVGWKYHTRVKWCYTKSGVTSVPERSHFFSSVLSTFKEEAKSGFIKTYNVSGTTREVHSQKTIENCLLKYGCVGTWMPWNRVKVNNKGTVSFSSGT
ncbi:hypothetical protein [Nonomuraea endophytica]|uniref:Uncharacterized protein n=1 Tax=Nonomuraea endophytica TaxID=714136 RepID=A0A7W7ZZX2_9ACTN|nr:hypothetical protein [Nonomuraea endophytica]MBB5076311.1 hypothetical protein [Nonomuraea endophytica]